MRFVGASFFSVQHDRPSDNLILHVGGNMNIYVSNLSYETTEEELRELFGQYGEITTLNIIKDKFTNRSRGFGFVEMPDNAQAEAAIEATNGKDFGGRNLNVAAARPRTEGTNRPRTGERTNRKVW